MASSKPVDNALDLLGRRWALRLVWELRRSTLAFSELRERTGISPSVLSARLGELIEAGVLEKDGGRFEMFGRTKLMLDDVPASAVDTSRVLASLSLTDETGRPIGRASWRDRVSTTV